MDTIMKKTLLALRIGLIAPLVVLFLSSGPFSPLPAPALAAGFVNLLIDPGLENFDAPYDQYNGHPLQVAQDWTAFTKSGATPKYMTNDEWASMTGGAAEHLEGDHSQMYWETEAFAAGIYQQVSVTPGTDYAAQASILTIWETSATRTDDKMLKQVGIDPNGGTDPNSPDIVWGPARGKDVQWESKVRTSATAISSTITLFVLVTSEASSSTSLRNQVFVDAVVLTKAPSASATSPALSTDLSFNVEWSGTPAYSGNSLEYDVEYKVDDGSWDPWKGKTASTSATFGPTDPTTVEYGHTYYFRARAWEDYGYYNTVNVKLPGVFAGGNGDASTFVGVIYGYVRNHWAGPIGGATVAISGTASSTTTDGSGSYGLPLPDVGSYEVTASHSGYDSPPAIPIDVYSATTTIPLTFTLRPPDDVVVNGNFEGDLSGWTTTGTAPTVVTSPLRSGDYSLAMGGSGAIDSSSGITQTHPVSGMHEPTLSFWYKIVTSETVGNDSFKACLYQNDPSDCAATFTVTPTADVDWTHQWLALGLDEVYTGAVGIYFNLQQDSSKPTTVYLDEVSLGQQATPALTITKQADPDPVQAGSQLTYTIRVTNTGDADATDVTITDTIPVSTTFAWADSGGGLVGNQVRWTGQAVNVGSSLTVTFIVTVTSPLPEDTLITNADYGVACAEGIGAPGSPVTTHVEAHRPGSNVYLPIVMKNAGPPSAPVPDPIDNPDGDGSYTVSWSSVSRAIGYVLQEDDNASFTSPTTVYSGASTSTTIIGRDIGTYYYRVQATNSFGSSPWSNVVSVQVTTTLPVPEPGTWYCYPPGSLTIRFTVSSDSSLVSNGRITAPCGSKSIAGPASIENGSFTLLHSDGLNFISATFDAVDEADGSFGFWVSSDCWAIGTMTCTH